MFLLFVTQCAGLLNKTHVRIKNDLGDGVNLTVHCKSKEDDLGVLVLPNDQFFEFSFRLGPTWSIFLQHAMAKCDSLFHIYIQKRDY